MSGSQPRFSRLQPTWSATDSCSLALRTMPAATRSSRLLPSPSITPTLKRATPPTAPTAPTGLPPTPSSPPLKRQKTTNAAGTTAKLPATLTFNFDAAKDHLINLDSRFARIFSQVKCRPFEELEEVDPFRTLVTSIVGQQVSWLAARAINHRFRRLYDPSLPEKPLPRGATGTDEQDDPSASFPTPKQVMTTDIATLKSAGLSTRKAEYVQSLAEHFDSGHLSAEFMASASDEEVGKRLIAVRGIGQWTVDMFEMFSLRRPDVLPVGDLGVQKGLLRWVLAAHAPGSVNFVKTPLKAKAKTPVKVKHESPATPPPATLMAFPPTPLSPREDFKPVDLPITPGPHASTATVASAAATPSIPPAHLIARPEDDGFDPHFSCPLPDGLTVEVLKSRLAGKKVKGGAYLTPAEMDALTAPWRPYRSLGVFYLWAVTEPES